MSGDTADDGSMSGGRGVKTAAPVNARKRSLAGAHPNPQGGKGLKIFFHGSLRRCGLVEGVNVHVRRAGVKPLFAGCCGGRCVGRFDAVLRRCGDGAAVAAGYAAPWDCTAYITTRT